MAVLLVLGALGSAAVARAGTATIGSPNLATESPNVAQNCNSSGCTQALTQLGSNPVTAPCPGTITQWSVRASVFTPDVTDNVELRVLAPGAGNTFGAVGTSAPIVVTTADVVHTATTALPVAAGDYIALEVPDNRVYTYYNSVATSAGLEVWDPPLVDGAAPSAPSFGGVGNNELLISAVVACTETLTVTNAQPADGVVKSTDGAINCGSACSHGYPSGTAVTLNATPVAGYRFAGWTGACTGQGACTVDVNSATAVTASFTPVPPPPPPPPPPPARVPNTAIHGATISSAHRRAKFTFKATGVAVGFQCALVKLPKHGSAPQARFSACKSPKSYVKLRPAKYEFLVRAFNSSGHDLTPAAKRFTIAAT